LTRKTSCCERKNRQWDGRCNLPLAGKKKNRCLHVIEYRVFLHVRLILAQAALITGYHLPPLFQLRPRPWSDLPRVWRPHLYIRSAKARVSKKPILSDKVHFHPFPSLCPCYTHPLFPLDRIFENDVCGHFCISADVPPTPPVELYLYVCTVVLYVFIDGLNQTLKSDLFKGQSQQTLVLMLACMKLNH
jgi:hypothetical protein